MKINFKTYFDTVKKYYQCFIRFIFDTNNVTSCNWNQDQIANACTLKKTIAPPIKFTCIVIALGVGFFVIWGSLAKLDSATVAPGFVVLSDNYKTIQHLEGGIIDKILIKEGDLVNVDQPLIILNDTAAKSRLQMILSQLRSTKAIENRLLAEQQGENSVTYSEEIFDTHIPEVQKIINTQDALFRTRVQSVKGKIDILLQKIAQYKEQIKGLETTKDALELHSLLTKEQVGNMQTLFDRGCTAKTDLFEIKKKHLEMEGRLGEIKGNIASVGEAISETQLQMLDFVNDNQREINDQLQKTQAQILDLQEQYQAAQDVLNRTIIKAPTAGIITGMQYHTISGVIGSGAKIMDIVPQNDELIIEAQVMPKDMESIKVGLRTKVQLSAYKSRLVPRVEGEVIYFSADRIHDERSKYPHYIARIRIPKEALDKINYDVKLYPGMPADVFIVKGERTFLQYMASPITDSLHRAFKEK